MLFVRVPPPENTADIIGSTVQIILFVPENTLCGRYRVKTLNITFENREHTSHAQRTYMFVHEHLTEEQDLT